MKIGIVSYWFNRGQAVVARHMRSIFDNLGHETFILARLTRKSFFKPFFVDRGDVWNQPNVTAGSGYDMPVGEYLDWVDKTGVEVVFFDQNLQFDAIAALRQRGIVTIGRFVWESFGPVNVEDALRAFNIIYSLTHCEQIRYKRMGIESPFVPWGCHPELIKKASRPYNNEEVRFFYPGGYLSKRKPTEAAIEAFRMVEDPRARLVIKAQHGIRGQELADYAAEIDQRIEVIVSDLPTDEHHALYAGSDVSLAPSRWEGLGLHLFEAVSFGLPTITNDAPPMNEIVTHDVDGWLIKSTIIGERRPGVPVLEPDIDSMADAMRALCNDEKRSRLREGVIRRQTERSWESTVIGYQQLLELSGIKECTK